MTGRFAHLPPLTDEEEAAIQREIANDPDAYEATDEELAHPMTFAEAHPELAESIKRNRGRPKLARPKEQVSLRLSADVLDHFRAGGAGWQARIDEALREAVKKAG